MWMLLVVALLASNAVACEKDCYEYQGNCACEQKPIQLSKAEEVQPSDEKPSRHPQPAYQRGDLNVSSGVDERKSAYEHDKAIDDATAQGKLAAGIQ